MNRLFLTIVGILFFAAIFAQEVVGTLDYNPQLYYKAKAAEGAMKSSISGNYLYLPDTLSLPFIDDFSNNRLRKGPGKVLDTIYRSAELSGTVEKFNFTKQAYLIQWLGPNQLDSTPLPFSDTLILNNDCGDVFLRTDTLYGYPNYYSYILDDTTGLIMDTILVDVAFPDSFIKYSKYIVVKDADSTSLWTDDQVFINDNYPINKISYGVATFDGLNANGVPYNINGSVTSPGSADTLTSKPIDLSAYSAFDSVYLSFFYEPQGLGDYPDRGDSLVLEFKTTCDHWDKVWSTDGFDSEIDSPSFHIVLIHLSNPFYLNNAFQFRFRNKASLTGNNDHWHIDYVYMNNHRSSSDSIMQDATVMFPPENFLKNYQAMPWEQFKDNQADESKDRFDLVYRNNYATPKSINFGYYASEVLTHDSISLKELTANPPATFTFDTSFLTSEFLPLSYNSDSVIISLRSYIDTIPFDLVRANDTATRNVNLLNYYAYDDGSAEKSYGVDVGNGLKKFAYEFNLNHPDTLRAIQIHFSSIDYRLIFQEVTLMVWSHIDFVNNTDDTLAFKKISAYTFYVDELNGFATYRLDTPIIVQDKFYIGWAQFLSENLQVGLDLNNNANEHMFYFSEGEWWQSLVDGAPMIRPVLGKYVPIIGTGVEPKPVQSRDEISFYPNPVEKTIYFKIPDPGASYYVRIFDLTGRQLYVNRLNGNTVDVEDLQNGLYLLQVINQDKQKMQLFRFIKMNGQ